MSVYQMYDVSGACDMHIHTGPDFVDRVGDDIDVARDCASHNFKAILLKNHMESTVSRAYHANKQVEGIEVFGSLVLNSSVGGINPFAAEAAMKYGAKEIFMPTFCSKADFQIHGKGQEKLYKYGIKTPCELYTVLDDNGDLTSNVKSIIELGRDYNVPIGTSHLGYSEIIKMVEFAHDIKAKIIVTHPEYKIPNLDSEQVGILAKMGAFIEITAGAVFPIPGCSTIARDIQLIEAAGYENCILDSDAGTPTKPMPADVLSSYCYCLKKKGLDKEKIDYMFKETPLKVFNIN